MPSSKPPTGSVPTTPRPGQPGGRLTRRGLLAAGGLVAAGAALRLARPATTSPVTEAAAPVALMPARFRPPSARTQPVAPAAPGQSASDHPEFSYVERGEPWDVLLFLAGRHPRYPGASLDSLMGFSPADILETMDTDVLDTVQARYGERGVSTLYGLIAGHILDALLVIYAGAPVLLALDAGHGGKRGVFFDPGSQGTEWVHTRRVVAAVEEAVADPAYAAITTRRIFNDDIGEDFFLPPPNDRRAAAALAIRNARGAMLAYEAAEWNAAHPDAPVALHVLSVHFNADSGGTLVLHQGSAVPDEFRARSIAYAQEYVARVRPALNASGLLPYALRLALGTGLSDDRLLYEPPFRFATPINPYTGVDRSTFPRRYAMLQASLLEWDYADGALRYHKLV